MTKLYGIKNCDTVKKARNWLDDHKIVYEFHDFRVQGVTAKQVKYWLTEIGLEKLINKRSTTWKELDDSTKEKLSEKNAAALLTEHPTLIKRPVLEIDDQLHVGFSTEDYKIFFK
jgi:arsenate reductase (glutaredoxin)